MGAMDATMSTTTWGVVSGAVLGGVPFFHTGGTKSGVRRNPIFIHSCVRRLPRHGNVIGPSTRDYRAAGRDYTARAHANASVAVQPQSGNPTRPRCTSLPATASPLATPPDPELLNRVALRCELIDLGYTDRAIAVMRKLGVLARIRHGAYADAPVIFRNAVGDRDPVEDLVAHLWRRQGAIYGVSRPG